jgi:phospholipid/cholesterol/gamma-HCH transport system substrate-binding protein
MTRRVIVLTALAAAALAVAAVWQGSDDRYAVTARFGDVRGLVEGAPVRAAGLPVGRVDSISLGSDGLPRVRLAIDSTYKLTRGARAAMRTASLSGENNAYISVSAGSGPPLPRGAVLHGSSPVQVDEALSGLTSQTRSDLRATLAGIDRATEARGPDIARTLSRAGPSLAELSGLLADVDADGTALRSLVHDSAQIASSLSSRSDRLGAAVESTATLVGVAARRQSELRLTLARLPGALRETTGALASARLTVRPLRTLVHEVAPALPLLVPTAKDLEAVARGARPTLSAVTALARAAPADLRALTPLLVAAKPVAGDLVPVLNRGGPILDQARVRLPDAFSFFSNWADFTANYDANGHAARVGIVFPPAPTDVQEPDSNAAGQLKAPFLRTPGALEGEPWRDFRSSFAAGRTK